MNRKQRRKAADVGTLIYIAQAGKWSMSVDEFLDAMEYFFGTLHAHVVQYTEVSPEKFQHPKVTTWFETQGIDLHHPSEPGANECLTASKIPINFRRSHARRLSDLVLKVGRKQPTYLLTTFITTWGKFRFLHTPAHTDGLKPGLWPTRVWRAVMARMKRIVKNYKGTETVGGDINYDLNRKSRAAVIDPYFHGLTYTGDVHSGDDLGGRLITGVWTNLRIVEPAKVMKRQPGHDHAPVRVLLARA